MYRVRSHFGPAESVFALSQDSGVISTYLTFVKRCSRPGWTLKGVEPGPDSVSSHLSHYFPEAYRQAAPLHFPLHWCDAIVNWRLASLDSTEVSGRVGLAPVHKDGGQCCWKDNWFANRLLLKLFVRRFPLKYNYIFLV